MTTESALQQIVTEQKRSGLSMRDYYVALATISRHHGLLSAALKLTPNYSIGAPCPLPSDILMEQLTPPKP